LTTDRGIQARSSSRPKRAPDKRYRLIILSRNFGHQIAITVGLDHAAGRAVIVMDGDLQDSPEIVLEMIAKWMQGYTVVSAECASRQSESRFKRATADLFYRLTGRLGDVSTPRNAGDFRLVDRRALDCFLAMPERDRLVRGVFRLDRVPPENRDLRSPAARRGGGASIRFAR
jgi:glycosyltransferase involved in cell wall biosynthesis